MSGIQLNGRFLTRAPTGVDRSASELMRAIGELDIAGDVVGDIVLPRGAKLWQEDEEKPMHRGWNLRQAGPAGLTGHLWEQAVLPFAAGRGTLLNFCSTAPLLRRDQAVMIHDAQVWDVPETFSAQFVAAYRALLPMAARISRHVLTVSEFSRRRLEHHRVVPEGKAVVVHNGADHMDRISADKDVLARHGLKPGSYFFALGSLARHKNLRTVIEARRKCGKDFPLLIVAGGGNARVFADTGLELAADEGRYIGRVTDAELKALYQGAIAFVFPSITEGFGLPPVEAMRCSCPVIATTGGAIPEICGDAAILVDPHSAGEWAQAMRRIAGSQDMRAKLISQGRARAGQFTWSEAARRIVNTLGLPLG